MIKLTVRWRQRSAEIEFPCSDTKLHQLLNEIRPADTTSNEIFVMAVHQPTALSMLEDQFLNMDEVNFLAKRMDSFTYDELLQFYAAAQYEHLQSPKDLINLTYNLPCYTVVHDLKNMAVIGKSHYMNVNGPITASELKQIDFAAIGRELIRSGNGRTTEFGLLFKNHEVPYEEVYDGINFPEYYHSESLMTIRVEHTGKAEYLYLPCEDLTITKAMYRVGAANMEDLTVFLESFEVDSKDWIKRLKQILADGNIYDNPDQLVYKAKAEKYAKIISKTIILSGMDAASFGQNAYFYDAAEGLLTATILLVAEFCEPGKRHIVSVFKIIQELLAPSNRKGKNEFQQLMEMLPNDHKAKWFAGAALNTAEQSMSSVMSTALSRLNAFLDSELEQLLCFDTEIDAEKFCTEKSAIFIIMPEENPNTFFMISLIIQQLYREILAVADEQGGKLKNRCVFFCDEFGTLPKIESAEMMFSASRSRRLQIVPIIQSFSQLDKNYGKEGAEIIVDNTQLTIFGGFAPNSSSAEVLSKALGSRTVMSGSVSQGKNDPSRSLQMIERPLMTPDELKSMPKGQFVVMKTGFHPMKVRLKLFFQWGIQFDEKNPYTVPEHGNRKVAYAEKRDIQDGIMKKFHADLMQPEPEPASDVPDGHVAVPAEYHDPAPREVHKAPVKTTSKSKKSNGGGKSKLKTCPPNRKPNHPPGQGEIAHE